MDSMYLKNPLIPNPTLPAPTTVRLRLLDYSSGQGQGRGKGSGLVPLDVAPGRARGAHGESVSGTRQTRRLQFLKAPCG